MLVVAATLAATLAITAPTISASPNATIDIRSSDASRAAALLADTGLRVRADVNGDGHADLIIGRPGARRHGVRVGRVRVILAGPDGLVRSSATVITLPHGAAGDRFGAAVALGDIDGDGIADLAIGAPGRRVAGENGAGVVAVHLGSRRGMTRRPLVVLDQSVRTGSEPGVGDAFGTALALGDFDGDGRSELVVGVPGADLRRGIDAGLVQVFVGTRRGVSTKHSWSSLGLGSEVGAAGSRLGTAVVAHDLDGDGRDELVLAAARSGARRAQGGVDVRAIVRGDRRGLRNANAEIVTRVGRPSPASPDPDDEAPTGDQPDWLRAINLYRSQAGLDPVDEQRSLSTAATVHSRWMVRHGIVSHSDDGGGAGGRSVVMGTTSATATDVSAINSWITGPFHALYLLYPGLDRVGFGSFRQDDPRCGPSGCIRMGATLDVLSSRSERPLESPNAWPGDGSVVGLNQHHGGERPDPQTTCTGAEGLPILAMFPSGATIERATFTTGSGDPLPSCGFDADSYVNPNADEQRLGRDILDAANAVVLMPQARLRHGERYCYDIRTSGGRIHGCFDVDLTTEP